MIGGRGRSIAYKKMTIYGDIYELLFFMTKREWRRSEIVQGAALIDMNE